jgi:hypothetical protein
MKTATEQLDAEWSALHHKLEIFEMKNRSDRNGEWLTKGAEKKAVAMQKQLDSLDAQIESLN